MYKIIIADDERLECASFKMLVKKNFNNVVVDQACDGIELIEKVNKHKPDILILDINMPKMSGLDALTIINSFECNPKVIIQSAYSEFELAQRAIELGVSEYVLKPVKKEKMVALIDKWINAIEKEKNMEQKIITNKRAFNKVIIDIEKKIIDYIIYGDFYDFDVEEYLTIAGIEKPAGCMMTVKIDDETVGIDIIKALSSQLKTLIGDLIRCVITSTTKTTIAIWIIREDYVSLREYNNIINQIDELISSYVENNYLFKVRIGIGSYCEDIHSFNYSYEESLSAVRGNISSEKSLYNIENIYDRKTVENFIKSIINCDHEQIKQSITHLLGCIEKHDINCYDSIAIVGEIINQAAREAYKRGYIKNRYEDFSLTLTGLMKMKKPTSFIQLKKYLLVVCNDIIDQIIAVRQNSNQSAITNMALEYIDNNYNKELSLTSISDHINISPYYLSRVFKSETNTNFVEYITNYRVEKAKAILKTNPKIKVKELCEMVGYHDSSYFCKVFKRITGSTVSEYRIQQ